MKGTKELRARIAGVKDTVKITKAMYAISAAKMPRATAARRQSQAYSDLCHAALAALGRDTLGLWCEAAPDAPTAWVVMAADKGLCGDYNERVWRLADTLVPTDARHIYTMGYMAREHYHALGMATHDAFVHMMTNPLLTDAQAIADALLADVMTGEIGQVKVIYTQAAHLGDQQVVCETLLPLDVPEAEYPYMPHPEDVEELVRHWVWARLYAMLADASCALNYKRMTSMQQACNNGEEMIATLTTQYNHERQAGITNELNDATSAKVANEEIV